MKLKDAYSTRDLSMLLDIAQQNVHARASRESWQSRTRKGRGGGHEWLISSMPESTRIAIRTAKEHRAIAESPRSHQPLALTNPTHTKAIIDDKRRHRALAKADIVRLYMDWQRKHGATRAQKAAFVIAYSAGAWPQLKEELGNNISWKSIERWKLEQSRTGSALSLVDKRGIAHKGRSLLTEQHHMIILGHILNPNAPKIS